MGASGTINRSGAITIAWSNGFRFTQVNEEITGSWVIVYDTSFQLHVQVFASGKVSATGIDGPGAATLQPATGSYAATGWWYRVDGLFSGAKFDYWKIENEKLHAEHWDGNKWHFGLGTMASTSPTSKVSFDRFVGERCVGTPYTRDLPNNCDGWSGITEDQCWEKCLKNEQAPNCIQSSCLGIAFYHNAVGSSGRIASITPVATR
jgi:hypothetical protein